MTKKLVILLVVISILAMSFTMAAKAVPPTAQRAIRLSGVYFSKNTLVVKFDAFGMSKKQNMVTSITVNQNPYQMSCVYDDLKHVTCKVANFNRFSGQNAHIWLVDSTFYFKVPTK